MLRRTCVAALLASAMAATPAVARDRTLYLGVEAGPMWANDVDVDIDTTEGEFDFFDLDHKLGYDIGVIFGYDAGIVRAELDLSYKRASHDELDFGSEGTEDAASCDQHAPERRPDSQRSEELLDAVEGRGLPREEFGLGGLT